MCKTKHIQPRQAEPEIFTFEGGVTGKQETVEFAKQDISSLGGLFVFTKDRQAMNFLKRFADCINEWRNRFLIKHTIYEMIVQRVLQIIAGYEDADDCDLLCYDLMLKYSCGLSPDGSRLCSQSTMCRLENHLSKEELLALQDLFVTIFIESYNKPPKSIILDFDDVNVDTYGNQENIHFSGYYGEYVYMPLLVFEGYSGKMIMPMLRPGRPCKRAEADEIIQQLIIKLRKAWPNTTLIIRGDAHFCSHELMEWTDTQRNVKFITGLSGNAALNRLATDFIEKTKKEAKDVDGAFKRYFATWYKAESWEKARRVIVKVEVTKLPENALKSAKKELNIRYVVTNFNQNNPKDLYEKCYCQRGKDELYNGEFKNGVMGDRLSCHKYDANGFRLMLHAAAYVVYHMVREHLFSRTNLQSASFNTIRTRVIHTAVVVKEYKHSIRFTFPEWHPARNELLVAFRRLTMVG